MRSISRPLAIIGALLLLAAGTVGLLVWGAESPPFSAARMNRIRAGMTANEVRTILGEPSLVIASTNETDRQVWAQWVYTRPLKAVIFRVVFNPQGVCTRHEPD
jgi:hypothetical protein